MGWVLWDGSRVLWVSLLRGRLTWYVPLPSLVHFTSYPLSVMGLVANVVVAVVGFDPVIERYDTIPEQGTNPAYAILFSRFKTRLYLQYER
jgi:hypothetical protein